MANLTDNEWRRNFRRLHHSANVPLERHVEVTTISTTPIVTGLANKRLVIYGLTLTSNGTQKLKINDGSTELVSFYLSAFSTVSEGYNDGDGESFAPIYVLSAGATLNLVTETADDCSIMIQAVHIPVEA